MKNIVKRIKGLEQRQGVDLVTRRQARVGAALDVLLADDDARTALNAFESYANRVYPNPRESRAACDADEQLARLYERVVAEATRLNAAWWLDGPGE